MLSQAIGQGCAANAWTHRSTATALNVSPGAARLAQAGVSAATSAAQPSRTGEHPGQACWRSQAARRSAEHVARASRDAGGVPPGPRYSVTRSAPTPSPAKAAVHHGVRVTGATMLPRVTQKPPKSTPPKTSWKRYYAGAGVGGAQKVAFGSRSASFEGLPVGARVVPPPRPPTGGTSKGRTNGFRCALRK